MSPPIHLNPTAPLAERVLLPGDPGRALMLGAAGIARSAQDVQPRPGAVGLHGNGARPEILTIQSSGMGGPSAAIVVTELAELGAGRIVRAGTCGALDPSLDLGELLLVGEAMAADGTSRALGARERVPAPPALLEAFSQAGASAPRTVVSTDLSINATIRDAHGSGEQAAQRRWRWNARPSSPLRRRSSSTLAPYWSSRTYSRNHGGASARKTCAWPSDGWAAGLPCAREHLSPEDPP